MKDNSLVKHIQHGRPDDFQTPPTALSPLMPYLERGRIIWECAAGKGNLSTALLERGYDVITSDVLTGQDFLTWRPEHFDYIVTNPPYSIRNEFLERCYTLGKPFALLMPLTSLEGIKRQALYKQFGVEIIIMPRRVNFETPSGNGSGSWFATAWFTQWLKIGTQLVFAD